LSSQAVARRYATALADVIVGKGQERIIQDELLSWELMIRSNSQLKEVFENPTIPYEQKRRVQAELIKRTGINQITANFLQVLLKNQRLTALHQINGRLSEVLDSRANVVAAHVTTAKPVNQDTERMLREKLSGFTGKSVRLDFSVDDSLVGGIITRIGSTVYDGSIRSQLDRMEKVLAG
jgi:F-type H+-transporting ATPase subunit delta